MPLTVASHFTDPLNCPRACADALEQRRNLTLYLDQIWQRYFSDIPCVNIVSIAYGRPWKSRLGLIRLALDNTTSFIEINALLERKQVPEYVLITTIAHVLVHYAHGFGSPLPRLYTHPHANNVVNCELELRGLGEYMANARNGFRASGFLFMKVSTGHPRLAATRLIRSEYDTIPLYSEKGLLQDRTEEIFMAVQPRSSSAIMLLRTPASGEGIEVFMLRRVIQSDFMPDVYVFPGGSVSEDDRAAELAPGVCTPVAPLVADPQVHTMLGTGTRAAAIRELFEEAGVLLADRVGGMLAMDGQDVAHFNEYRSAFNQRQGSLIKMAEAENLTLATDRLGYFAHWITPEGMPKRYDTHFFLAVAPAEQEAIYDQLETSEGVWVQPAEALARYEQGEFPLVFATIHQLHDLAAFPNVTEAIASTALSEVPVRMPVLVQENGQARVYLPEDVDNAWDVPEHMTRM